MKYKCLVFDHDDTTVNSSEKIHYPSFMAFMRSIGKELDMSFEEYMRYNFTPGIVELLRDICGLSPEEMKQEEEFWLEYVKSHHPTAFTGIKEIMDRQKAEGGIIAVVTHSYSDFIYRDFSNNDLPRPDIVFGWEQPADRRKPSPYPLEAIMEKYGLMPDEMLVIDDLKPGYDMARTAGVPFAAAGWSFTIEETAEFMKENADFYCSTVDELNRICF